MMRIADRLASWRTSLATDPRRVVRMVVGVIVGASGVAVVVTVLWAVVGMPAAPALAIQTPRAESATHVTMTDAKAWNVALWRPATDTAPVSAASTPFKAQLFSIIKRGDTITAALDLQDGNGLVYAKLGESVGEYHVDRIDGTAVVLTYHGTSQRLELAR
ncbi:MAG: hypothetical protein H0W83_04655 [Planctomycetes bacterium]|nr:hypothetical protein [Planctomycetota bacterium]